MGGSLDFMALGFYPANKLFDLVEVHRVWGLFFLFYLPVAQFSITPLLKLTGVYTYYSPMLMGYMANDKQIDLHSGGSFDYLFVMRKHKTGLEFRNRLLTYHLEGLLQIIARIENKAIPGTVQISGTSYFFNDRTLHKLGFKTETPTLFYRINLFANFLDLIWMF
jgi:hypothetical protein